MIQSVSIIQRFCDSNGYPLAGGKVFFYASGTSTKQAAYVDSKHTAQLPNPAILNTRGELEIWLDHALLYKVTLAPANDTDPPRKAICTVDQIIPGALIWPNTSAGRLKPF